MPLRGFSTHNIALEPTADSVRCAPAVGGGSPRALGGQTSIVRRSESDASVQ